MEGSSFGILQVCYCAGRDLVHTVLQDGHQLVRIEGPGLLNGRRKPVDNSGVSIRGVGRRLTESFYIAVNKGLCEFIVLNPTGIGIRWSKHSCPSPGWPARSHPSGPPH